MTRAGTGLPDALLTIAEAARILSCSERTVKRRLAEGSLPAIRFGRSVRIHPEDLARFIRAGRSQ